MAFFTPSLTYFSSCQLTRAQPGAEPSVVWLRGDHDVATVETLAYTDALGSWVDVPTTGRVDWQDASVTAEPDVAEQVSRSARVERPTFVRIP